MTYYSMKQINERHPGIGIDHQRKLNADKAKYGVGNVFKKMGGKVLVHEERLLKWIDLQNEKEIYGKINKADLQNLKYSELDGNFIAKTDDLFHWMEEIISLKVREKLVKKRHPY